MNKDKDFEHTRPLLRVSPDAESQKTQLLNARRVRELEPVEIPRRQGQQEAGQKPFAGQTAAPGYDRAGYTNTDYRNAGNADYGNADHRRDDYARGSYAQSDYARDGYGRPPVNGGGAGGAAGQAGGRGRRGYKVLTAVLLIFGFLAAAFCGAALSGYMSEQQAKRAALESQQAAAGQQLQEADARQKALNQQRAELEAEYERLLEEQKAARSEADKLKGQKEQQAKVQQDKTAAGKVLDKITGDAAKQKEEELAVAGREAESQQKLEAISQSVQAARDALGEVDTQLDNLDAMRQQAKNVRDEVDRAYTENKDVVDAVLHYVSVGLSSLFKAANE